MYSFYPCVDLKCWPLLFAKKHQLAWIAGLLRPVRKRCWAAVQECGKQHVVKFQQIIFRWKETSTETSISGAEKGQKQSYMYIEIYHIFNDAITQVTSVHITRVCLNIYTYTPYILICVRTSRVCKCQHCKHVLPCLNVRKHGLTVLWICKSRTTSPPAFGNLWWKDLGFRDNERGCGCGCPQSQGSPQQPSGPSQPSTIFKNHTLSHTKTPDGKWSKFIIQIPLPQKR